jgi:glycine/D-amino acid oxidase-like deaminating enzyme
MMNLRSGYPFWLIKNGLPYNYPKLDRHCNTDVCIIGGGISGALTAHYLLQAGISCVVADARTIGLGSTCASTSLLQYEIDIPLFQLCEKIGADNAVKAYQDCAAAVSEIVQLAQDIHFDDCRRKQSLYLAAYKKDLPFLQQELNSRQEAGFEVKMIEGNTLQNEYGVVAPGAILSACGAEINAYSFSHALLQYGMQYGLQVYDRTEIVKIDHHKSGVKMLSADGFKIEAKKIVYATGYEAVKYIDRKIVDLNSTFVTISEQANHNTAHWKDDTLIWNTADPYLYIRTTADNRMLVGGRDEPIFQPQKRDELIHQKMKQLVKDFNRIFPKTEFLPEFSWAGTFGSTKDGLPFIGAWPKLPHSYFALGFGGNGITFSLIAAKIIAGLLSAKIKATPARYSFERL